MFSLLLHPTPDQEDYLIAELGEQGTTGIIQENGCLRAFFQDDRDAEALKTRLAEFAPEMRFEPATDWELITREAWPPLLIGRRFFLAPPWSNEPTPAGRLRLEVYPGMACGTGRHPCTQLCLEAMEQCIRPGNRVLDVGAGSGVLSAAAALLGAYPVIGCDIDHEAVRLARERVALPLFTGSADAVRSGWADVIVANIDSAAIERLAAEFTRTGRPAATLILSGFPEWDMPDGFQARQLLRRGEWVCLVCRIGA